MKPYAPVAHRAVDAFVQDTIQGEPVPSDESPFAPGAIDVFCRVGDESAPTDAGDADWLTRISDLHGRSYALPWTLYWHDRYGNLFSQLNAKGNNCTEPYLCHSGNNPSGYAVYGLQDGDSLVRMLRASRLLREANVPTELMVRVLEPSTLIKDGAVLPVADFKIALAQDVVAGKKPTLTGSLLGSLPRDVSAIVEAMRTMTLFITIRGVQVNERISDLQHTTSPEEFAGMFANAFRFVNEEARMRAAREQAAPPTPLHHDNLDHLFTYLCEMLPVRAARTFAAMHKAGLWHAYPHTGNVSLVGSIYDLDSVRGEPLGLGDEPIEAAQRWGDISVFLEGMKSIDRRGAQILFYPSFRAAFLSEYITQFLQGNEDLMEALRREVETKSASHWPEAEQIASLYFSRLSPLLNDIRTIIREEVGGECTPKLEALLLSKIMECAFNAELNFDEFGSNTTMARLSRAAATRIVGVVLSDDDTENVRRWDVPGPAMVRVVRLLGYEEDIVANADKINVFFGNFETTTNRVEFDHYFGHIVRQLGCAFRCDFTRDELIARFHRHDEEQLRAHVAEALRNAAPEDQSQAALAAIASFDMVHDPGARYTDYMIHAIKDGLNHSLENAACLGAVRARYGEHAEEAIFEWAEMERWHEYETFGHEETDAELIRIADERVEALKRRFTPSPVAAASGEPEAA